MRYRFTTTEMEELYTTRGGGRLRRQFPDEVVRAFLRKVDFIADAESERDLFVQGGFDYKPADWFLSGSFSLRINRQYRLILFREEDGGVRLLALHQIVDYH